MTLQLISVVPFLGFLGLSACLAPKITPPILEVRTKTDGEAFVVTIVNKGLGPVCYAESSWPNSDGNTGAVSDAPYIEGATRNNYNKGWSPIGHMDRTRQIDAGDQISARMLWTDFERPDEITNKSELVMTLVTRACKP